MINILSYVGMNMQSEVCLWTLLGLVRTIFDATLFKVNANLIQGNAFTHTRSCRCGLRAAPATAGSVGLAEALTVMGHGIPTKPNCGALPVYHGALEVWQMSMPEEMSLPVQHVLRTIISGIMLVQCFTVYVYLASYIVLLYPVFLEERPTLVLPWLLLAAIRNLLCELTSLALGLGTCILLGPARPPCIRFLIVKITAILPAFYMWMLLYSYYHGLKLATSFKTFPAVLSPCGPDYGLELAVRRRRTKSLLGEQQLREKLVAGLYAESTSDTKHPVIKLDTTVSLTKEEFSDSSIRANDLDILQPLSATDNKYADTNLFDDFGSEPVVPRGSDRILEQFVVMLLKIASYLKRDGTESINSQMFNADVNSLWPPRENMESVDVTETPPHIANSKGPTASYLQEYPQIFMKKLSSEVAHSDVWQIHNLTSVGSGPSSQSISSNEAYNKVNSEINRICIEKAVDKLALSKGKEVQQSSKLSVIASRDTSLHNLEQIDKNSKCIDQPSSKENPSTSKKIEENVNKDTSNTKNTNEEKISFEILSPKSVSTIMTRELTLEHQGSKEMAIDNNQLVAANSDSVANTAESESDKNDTLPSSKTTPNSKNRNIK